jgi:hypothetical protein
MQQLLKIQSELKAPKNQFNSFGKYKYRSCEDILEAAKPLLAKYGCTLTLTDDIKTAGSITYVESTATLCHEGDCVSVTAQAGIDVNRKGMDIAQSFGSSSSYARKYSLSGLFLLDDSKDADATNTHGKDEISRTDLINLAKKLPDDKAIAAIKAINEAKDITELERIANRLNQLKTK